MAGIKFEIEEKLGQISERKGWKKEVNLVSWNGKKSKLDIREWDEEYEKMGRGITLSKKEIIELYRILDTYDLDELEIS